MIHQETSFNGSNAGHVADFLREQREFIRDLRLGTAKIRGSHKLWQLLAAHGREINRRLSGDPGSPKYYEDLRTYWAMLVIYIQRHVRRLEARKEAGIRLTNSQRKTTRFLIVADNDMVNGLKELASRFPKSDLTGKLAQKIWLTFLDVTVDEAKKEASAIESFFANASEEEQTGA
jgi:hypothetical protein